MLLRSEPPLQICKQQLGDALIFGQVIGTSSAMLVLPIGQCVKADLAEAFAAVRQAELIRELVGKLDLLPTIAPQTNAPHGLQIDGGHVERNEIDCCVRSKSRA